MKPLRDIVVIEVGKDQEEWFESNGIVLPGEMAKKTIKKKSGRQYEIKDEGQYMRIGTVFAVGPEVKVLTEGDEVLFNRHNGHQHDQLHFIREQDIVCQFNQN